MVREQEWCGWVDSGRRKQTGYEKGSLYGESARRSAEREYNLQERELQTLATVTGEEGEIRIRMIRG